MAKQKKRKLKRGYRILRGIYAAVVAVAAIIVIGYGVYNVTIRPPDVTAPAASDSDEVQVQGVAPELAKSGDRREQTYTFLLTCPDQSSGNADAIMVVTYDVPNQKVGMLSIPRDTLVQEGYPKINASLHEGVENLQSVVSELVGFPIDFYISIDLDGFVELVDSVGGIEFDVPVEMYYSDPSQDLTIYYQPGLQHLYGQQAMEVCRFRKNADGTGYPQGDIQRSETVQKLMLTVAKKMASNLGRLGDYIDIVQRNVETDLSASNILWFATQAAKLDLGTAVSNGTLPGDGNVTARGVDYCYELYPSESLDLINQLVNPYTTSLSASDVNFCHLADNGKRVKADASLFQTQQTTETGAQTSQND